LVDLELEAIKDIYWQNSMESTLIKRNSFVAACKRAINYILNKNELKPQQTKAVQRHLNLLYISNMPFSAPKLQALKRITSKIIAKLPSETELEQNTIGQLENLLTFPLEMLPEITENLGASSLSEQETLELVAWMFTVAFAGERVCPSERDCFLLYTGFLARETYGQPFLGVLEQGFLSLDEKAASRFGL
jgi:hypothetical protein